MIITIDGPAGGGKSTLSVSLAKHLGFFCLNSGYLYRGMAYVLKVFYAYSDEMLQSPKAADVQAIIESGQFRYDYFDGLSHVYFGDDDITQFLKRIENGQAAAIIAQHDVVRKIIQQYERSLAQQKDSVIEGRACGSAQFKDADIKFYVIASPEIRAQRAVQDQAMRGFMISIEQALKVILARDAVDLMRKHDPLVVPQGAIILDTSNLSKEQVLGQALEVVRRVIKNKGERIK